MTVPFDDLAGFRKALSAAPARDEAAVAAARARNAELTKPPGALGRLEDIAIWYAGWRGDERPWIERAQALVFAGNHGVAARGVSAFPPSVTEQMVANFTAGGAAINQLSLLAGAWLDVHALDLDTPTADFTAGAAMTEAECTAALARGWAAVDAGADALVVGEMGIGNTTAAAALCAALYGGAGADWAGPGTGVADAALKGKIAVIDAGLARHRALDDPLMVLAALGGREIAAMAGAIAAARVHHVPVVLDGFICGAAAAVLHRAVPGALDHCIAGHVSAERGHARLLAEFGKQPLLSLGMRLGEGSGAAVALLVLRAAIATHSGMATFAEAGVSGAA